MKFWTTARKEAIMKFISEPIACVFRIHVYLYHNLEDYLRLEVYGGLLIALQQGPLLNRTEHPCFNAVMHGLSVRLVMVVVVPVLVLGAVLMMFMVVVLLLSYLFHFPLYPATKCDTHFPQSYLFLKARVFWLKPCIRMVCLALRNVCDSVWVYVIDLLYQVL